ncbi:hypothetical protein D3C76_165560 [compost metagenome]
MSHPLYQAQENPLELSELAAGDINTGLNVVEVVYGGVVFKVQYLRPRRLFEAVAFNGDRKTAPTMGKLKAEIKAYAKLETVEAVTLQGKTIGHVMRQVDDKFFYRPKGTKGKFDGDKFPSRGACLKSVWGDDNV